jgi:crossover junction endodeoxyribonuclease RuvC
LKVLGIDPGYGRLGFGIVERLGGAIKVCEFGLVETDKGLCLPDRLAHIHGEVRSVIQRSKPSCMATEAILFAANRTTAIGVAKALGVVLLAAAEAGLPWCEYTPPEVKATVTGSGAAKKAQVQFMVAKLLSLKEAPKPDDVSDALAVALCHAIRGRLAGL